MLLKMLTASANERTLSIVCVTRGIDMFNKCYSTDEENFNWESLSELIEDNELEVGSAYWEADAIPVTHADNIHVGNILEYMDERLYDEVGEIADCDYSNVTHEAELELRDLMLAWAEKHVKLRYWKVRNAKEMQVQPEDLE